ncbi:hypothetical protein GCM10022284_71490 [Streptomyces hundungensis]
MPDAGQHRVIRAHLQGRGERREKHPRSADENEFWGRGELRERPRTARRRRVLPRRVSGRGGVGESLRATTHGARSKKGAGNCASNPAPWADGSGLLGRGELRDKPSTVGGRQRFLGARELREQPRTVCG